MRRNIIVLLAMSCLVTGCVSAKPRMETYMGRAVFDANISMSPKEVVKNVYDSISLRSTQLTKTVAFMPAELPEQPGTPNIGIKSMGFGFVTIALPQTTCDGAYAVLGGFDKGISSSAYGTSDFASYTSCIYPYKDAYRIYLIGNFMSSSSGGLQGIMADAIKKGVSDVANYDNMFAAWFDSIVKRMRTNFPDAREVEVSLPQ